MQNIKPIQQIKFDYTSSSDPTVTENPRLTPCTWLNSDTGHIWVCTDNTIDTNVWVDNG